MGDSESESEKTQPHLSGPSVTAPATGARTEATFTSASVLRNLRSFIPPRLPPLMDRADDRAAVGTVRPVPQDGQGLTGGGASVAIEELRKQADAAIAAKASELGNLAGSPLSDLIPIAVGWKRPYQGCDIYYSLRTGAHEVHGAIKAKYDALNGPEGVLGLPLTDETAADNGGRYNDFERGSIYWTDHTGPMMVRGSIRNVWSAAGWEQGPLGYPVSDEQHLAPTNPLEHPNVRWSLFENGAIVRNADGTFPALAARISPDRLRRLVREAFDLEIHKSPDDIGLQPPVETTAVSTWSYDFWQSIPRTITFRLYGFHDNGLAPDTDFELDVRLHFALTWPARTLPPQSKSLIVALEWVQVTAHGLFPQTVADGVRDGVMNAFFRGGPDPAYPEVPDGAKFVASLDTGISTSGSGNMDMVDILTTVEGGLDILVPAGPVIAGQLSSARQYFAQERIDAMFP